MPEDRTTVYPATVVELGSAHHVKDAGHIWQDVIKLTVQCNKRESRSRATACLSLRNQDDEHAPNYGTGA